MTTFKEITKALGDIELVYVDKNTTYIVTKGLYVFKEVPTLFSREYIPVTKDFPQAIQYYIEFHRRHKTDEKIYPKLR